LVVCYTAWAILIGDFAVWRLDEVSAAAVAAVLGAVWLAAVRMEWVRIFGVTPEENGGAA
jgi:hypothetical protein